MQRRHHRPGLSTDWDLEDDLELSLTVGDHLAPGDHRGTTPQALDDEEAVRTGDVWVGDEDDEEVPRVRGLLIAPADGMSLAQQERIRRILLALACLLAIGSHYGAYLLGPLKHSFKTSEGNFSCKSRPTLHLRLHGVMHSGAAAMGGWAVAQHSVTDSAGALDTTLKALISSFELSNTITPLISGLLVPKFGAARVGLFSTAIVLCGLLLVVYGQLDDREGGGVRSVGTMISGLFIFGLGLAPIAVVQESIILRHNTSNSTTMARTVAIGLLLGKFVRCSVYISSHKSKYPLSTISPRLPFIIATFLAMFSFLCCLLYSMVERTLPAADPREQLKDDHGRWVPLSESTLFGDLFWFYIAVCFLAGGWYSTIHLSTSLLMSIYQITESQAASSASQILFASTLLYPVIGWALDRRPSILARLYMAVPLSISATYIILLSFTSVVPHYLALTPSAIGIGGGPLLLVVVVPRIVERQCVIFSMLVRQTSTALGLHKSLEMAGAVISQTITAAILSTPHSAFESPKVTGADKDRASALFAVSLLLLFCELQLGVIIWWWTSLARFERDRSDDDHRGMEYGLVPTVEENLPSVDTDRINSENELHPELEDHVAPSLLPPISCHSEGVRKGSASAAETRRGVWALRISLLVVAISWVAFGGNLVWG
ncbi:BZ3500_MvSof-1268-A1-R1_Chr6-2g08461 [Microbotryum saponariae]|uniref:Lysosomal dipeptide transporter MFSD1 n=1 Tax=Microbotryum saponariae TaxID=289078 RepID=A0A2X0MG23_9BASI|nr:BZ3500_MvSof-1268-A1-R1_Chr6-2g08461 [Microbotryum saponariae]SDA07738.1 BZ3501_MvSof-1269-A2-R1_Chr6-1g08175 [Microbotryum saponariae]